MMAHWHIPWDYMDTRWTCRQVEEMYKRLCERLKFEREAQLKGISDGNRNKSR